MVNNRFLLKFIPPDTELLNMSENDFGKLLQELDKELQEMDEEVDLLLEIAEKYKKEAERQLLLAKRKQILWSLILSALKRNRIRRRFV